MLIFFIDYKTYADVTLGTPADSRLIDGVADCFITLMLPY